MIGYVLATCGFCLFSNVKYNASAKNAVPHAALATPHPANASLDVATHNAASTKSNDPISTRTFCGMVSIDPDAPKTRPEDAMNAAWPTNATA